MWFGLLFVLIGSRPLIWGWRSQNMGLFRCGVVIFFAGLFDAFLEDPPLHRTLSHCHRLPLYPIFAELSKGGNGFFRFDFPGLISFYWMVLAWLIETAGISKPVTQMIDSFIFVTAWILIVVSMYSNVELVRFHRRRPKLYAVLFAAIPATITHFLPAPSSPPLWQVYDVFYFLSQAYALRSVLVFLAACQADEGSNKFEASWSLLFGFIPHVYWVTGGKTRSDRRKIAAKKKEEVLSGWVYLDHNATTPLDGTVRRKMAAALDNWGNPGSAAGPFAEAARIAIERAKASVAELLGCGEGSCGKILITSGGTESNNAALWAVLGKAAVGSRCLISPFEHPAIEEVLKPMQHVEIVRVPVDKWGMIVEDQFVKELKRGAVLVSIMWANNEIGAVQNMARLVELTRKYCPSALFHSDASQAVGKVQVQVGDLDLLTLAAHKFYGPKAIGALYIKKPDSFTPLLRGGSQQAGLRAGTESALLSVGLGVAASVAKSRFEQGASVMRSMRDLLWSRIKQEFPAAQCWSGNDERTLPNTLSCCLGPDSPLANDLVRICGAEHHVLFSAGAACHSGSHHPSATLMAIGVPVPLALRTLRLSTGISTTAEHIEQAIEALKKAYLSA